MDNAWQQQSSSSTSGSDQVSRAPWASGSQTAVKAEVETCMVYLCASA